MNYFIYFTSLLISLTYYLALQKLHAWDVCSVTASSHHYFCWFIKWVSLSLLSFLYPRESTPDFKWRGWLNGGKNQNPKKSLGLPAKPKKIPGPKISPPNIPCWISKPRIMFFVFVSFRHKFLAEFLEVGGVLTVLEILGLKQAKEVAFYLIYYYFLLLVYNVQAWIQELKRLLLSIVSTKGSLIIKALGLASEERLLKNF